jgi:hypothetical protein
VTHLHSGQAAHLQLGVQPVATSTHKARRPTAQWHSAHDGAGGSTAMALGGELDGATSMSTGRRCAVDSGPRDGSGHGSVRKGRQRC